MKPIEKLEKTKAKLMLEHPYIGSVASMLPLKECSDVLYMQSDGVSIVYNPEYLERASTQELLYALANGAMHTLLKHHERSQNRIKRLWQVATDMVVNAMLVENGFTLPPYAYYEKAYAGRYAEDIYADLIAQMNYNEMLEEGEETVILEEESSRSEESEPTTPPSTPTPPAYEHKDEPITPEELEAMRQELEAHFEQLFEKFKRAGELPKGLERLVPAYFKHKIGWQEQLYRYIATYAKSTYSFMPPNKRYLYQGVSLPSLSSDLMRIVVAIDTSGSVDEALLGRFLAEVEGIMQQYHNYEIDLIAVDAKVHSHKTYYPGERLSYRLKGGGGTDFRALFSYVAQHIDYPTLLLYFTDGLGIFPQEAPLYDLLWVMPHAHDVPFGEVLLLQD